MTDLIKLETETRIIKSGFADEKGESKRKEREVVSLCVCLWCARVKRAAPFPTLDPDCERARENRDCQARSMVTTTTYCRLGPAGLLAVKAEVSEFLSDGHSLIVFDGPQSIPHRGGEGLDCG